MTAIQSIKVDPDEIEEWLRGYGPGDLEDHLDGALTEITVDDAERLAQEITSVQFGINPEAGFVDFSFVRSALAGKGYHPALGEKMEPLISASFRRWKDRVSTGS